MDASKMSKGGRDRQARILVVEDDDDARCLLADALERRGYWVQTTPDGKAAWRLFRRKSESGHDLVITDLNMPEMDGMELLRRIKGEFPKTAVILLTTSPGHGVMLRARALGAFAVLAKPYDLEKLVQTVQSALIEMGLHERR